MTTAHANAYLHQIREHELQQALTHFPAVVGPRGVRVVVEVGAGTGIQAAALHALGYDVRAFDLETSAYRTDRVFPVAEYDGERLPLADGSADVVFSSNVLEHIAAIVPFLAETRRVMNDDALSIHVLPTPAWRFWTLFGHYGWLAKRVLATLFRRAGSGPAVRAARADGKPVHWFSSLYPEAHGERGNAIGEIYLYSLAWWTRTFRDAGFEVVDSRSAGLFYTGGMVLADRLSMAARQRLAHWLGSSCRVYVLRAKGKNGAHGGAVAGPGHREGGTQ